RLGRGLVGPGLRRDDEEGAGSLRWRAVPSQAKAMILLAALLLFVVSLAPVGAEMQIQPVNGASGVEAWLVEEHSVPVVTIRFAFPGGAALDPAGKSGTASMAASMLDEGAGPYDHAELHRRLDELAGELRFSAAQSELDASLRPLKPILPGNAALFR